MKNMLERKNLNLLNIKGKQYIVVGDKFLNLADNIDLVKFIDVAKV